MDDRNQPLPRVSAPGPCVRRPQRDNTVWHRGHRVSLLLTAADTSGQCAFMLATLSAGQDSPRHIQQHEDETIYVLQGAVVVYAATAIPAPAGTCVFLPRGTEHAVRVASESATVLVVFTPAGYEGYIRALGVPVATHAGPPAADDPLAIERMVAAAATYGCEITGPPPADDPSYHTED